RVLRMAPPSTGLAGVHIANNLAALAEMRGDRAAAESLYRSALDLAGTASELEAERGVIRRNLDRLSSSRCAMGSSSLLRPLWSPLLLVAGTLAPQELATGTWPALDAQAAQLYDQGNLPKAIEVAQQALRMAASASESGRSLDRLGFLLYTSGNLPDG